MTFFSKLFGINSSADQPVAEPQIDRALFVDDSEPQLPDSDGKTRELSTLELLQKRNFEPEGYRDGYDTHSTDMLELKLQTVASEFQEAYRDEIDKIESRLQAISPFLTQKVKETIPQQYVKMESEFDSLSLKKVSFEAQLELARKKEGLCERALRNYRIGFIKGFSFWSDENHFTSNL
ncbi:MAG: hypothetical protein ABR574_11195 [Cryomorphaceae bacterium]